MNDFMSSVLLHRPDHVFDFAREYFSAFQHAEPEEAERAAKEGDARAAAAAKAVAPEPSQGQ